MCQFYLVRSPEGPLDLGGRFIATGRTSKGALFVAEFDPAHKVFEVVIAGEVSYSGYAETVENAGELVCSMVGVPAAHNELEMDQEAQL